MAGPPPADAPAEALRAGPPHRHGGLLVLLRFMRRNRMLNARYARLLARLARHRFLARSGRRLELDGLAFIDPGVALEVGGKGRVRLGRSSWVGHGTKIRAHEGVVSIDGPTP